MVRRATAREGLVEKTSLRKCIRFFDGDWISWPGWVARVSVLISCTVVEDHCRYQAADTPL